MNASEHEQMQMSTGEHEWAQMSANECGRAQTRVDGPVGETGAYRWKKKPIGDNKSVYR